MKGIASKPPGSCEVAHARHVAKTVRHATLLDDMKEPPGGGPTEVWPERHVSSQHRCWQIMG